MSQRFLSLSLFLLVCPMVLASGNGKSALRQAAARAIKTIPTTEPATTFAAEDVHAFFIEGAPPWHGNPTRIFAWYGTPANTALGQKFPAVLLVHGGGGTAFANWVKIWTKRGYAALAIDTCGQLPHGKPWDRDPAGGPPGWGGFEQVNDPPIDQWPYHAEVDCILAHSLLRSFPEVDSSRVGIVGISWGGYLTCLAAGLDDRFAFAIPVYGCGFLGENSAWVPTLKNLGPEKEAAWLKAWDPSEYLPGACMPMLWVDGTNDANYPLDSLQKSYRLPQSTRTLVTRVGMKHNHSAGWAPEEIYAFADSICKTNAIPLAKISGQGFEAGKAWATFIAESPIQKAELNYTMDSGIWKTRKWIAVPAVLDATAQRVSASVPPSTTVYYFNLTDNRNLLVSTEHVEMKP